MATQASLPTTVPGLKSLLFNFGDLPKSNDFIPGSDDSLAFYNMNWESQVAFLPILSKQEEYLQLVHQLCSAPISW